VPSRRPESSPQTRAVLRALREAPGWSYGYDLSRLTGLKSGTLYPMLARLAERGLLETAWEQAAPPGRPPRHLYRLSAAGAELAKSLSPVFVTRPSGSWTVAGTGQA
jgi:PadR family transcriptional regulator, regulatory protein PadR